MATIQLPASKRFDTNMAVDTATQNIDISLALEFQKHLSNEQRKHVIKDHVKHTKRPSKKVGKIWSIICNIIKMSIIRT